jgi:hypothetical protein
VTFDLELDRKAQKCPDQDDTSEQGKTAQIHLKCHRIDDICGNEKLQPEQDRAPSKIERPMLERYWRYALSSCRRK